MEARAYHPETPQPEVMVKQEPALITVTAALAVRALLTAIYAPEAAEAEVRDSFLMRPFRQLLRLPALMAAGVPQPWGILGQAAQASARVAAAAAGVRAALCSPAAAAARETPGLLL
jgi:hypothetical protein